MTDTEKRIAQDVLDTGKLLYTNSFEDLDGTHIESFTVEESNEVYEVTKWDGEIVYFFHYINREDARI